MRDYFIRRFLLILPTLIGATMIVFFITRITPGGPMERAMQTALAKEFVAMLQQWHAPKEGRAVVGVVPQRVGLSEAFGAGTVPTDPAVVAVLGKLQVFAEG